MSPWEPVKSCPVCEAALQRPRAACWLCRHPIPERLLAAAPPAQPPEPPQPLVEARRKADDEELDATSLIIFAGLVAATLGAYGASFKGGTLLCGLVLLPIMYLALATGPEGLTANVPMNAKKALRVLAITVGVVVLVPIAISVALLLACTVMVLGFGVLPH